MRKNIPERKIIWENLGLESRVKELETQINVPEATGGGSGSPSGYTPNTPTSLTVSDQAVHQDNAGQTWTEVELSWEGNATEYEVAIARKQ